MAPSWCLRSSKGPIGTKMVKAAAKAAKKREPAWMTERRKVEMERRTAMVRAFRKAIGRDVDAPIKPGKSYRMLFDRLKGSK
jgi:hypothetical protein